MGIHRLSSSSVNMQSLIIIFCCTAVAIILNSWKTLAEKFWLRIKFGGLAV